MTHHFQVLFLLGAVQSLGTGAITRFGNQWQGWCVKQKSTGYGTATDCEHLPGAATVELLRLEKGQTLI